MIHIGKLLILTITNCVNNKMLRCSGDLHSFFGATSSITTNFDELCNIWILDHVKFAVINFKYKTLIHGCAYGCFITRIYRVLHSNWCKIADAAVNPTTNRDHKICVNSLTKCKLRERQIAYINPNVSRSKPKVTGAGVFYVNSARNVKLTLSCCL